MDINQNDTYVAKCLIAANLKSQRKGKANRNFYAFLNVQNLPITLPSLSVVYSIYAVVESSSRILPTLKSLGGLGKCSVTNHCNRGHPLNFAISPVLDFGSPFKQASDVNATVIPHELNKKPTCCGGVSDVDNGNSIGSGTSPRNMHPYQAVMKLQWNFNLDKNNH